MVRIAGMYSKVMLRTMDRTKGRPNQRKARIRESGSVVPINR